MLTTPVGRRSRGSSKASSIRCRDGGDAAMNMRARRMPPIVEARAKTFDAVNDYFYERGWTDGLPIVPPTEERVESDARGHAVARAGRAHQHRAAAHGHATMRQIAVNAVMAGAQARVSAGRRRRAAGGLRARIRSLAPADDDARGRAAHHRERPDRRAAAHQLRPRACSARAGARTRRSGARCGWCWSMSAARDPGVDASQTGHPGKYTYCIAEYEAANPWEPLHVERGFDARTRAW